jgi:hypothetical protein
MKRDTQVFTLAAGLLLAAGSAAQGQLSITWSTVDGGGGEAAGGVFSLSATIGQADAGPAMTGVVFSLSGGYWPAGSGAPPCRPDMTGDGQVNVQDFLRFLSLYSGGDPLADFTRNGTVNVQDFLAFLSAYAAGC